MSTIANYAHTMSCHCVCNAGVPNAIPKLAESNIKSTLAVSIHAPNQEIRQQLIPSAKAYPLGALMKVSPFSQQWHSKSHIGSGRQATNLQACCLVVTWHLS
jgi:adenine C2-methylase RlmN of 23S rRNA A2503 and tRNA A37